MGCIPYSLKVSIERQEIDTNPRIVQMVCPPEAGRCKSHFYYLSDQHIASRFGPEGTDYTGPVDQLSEDVGNFYTLFRDALKAEEWRKMAQEIGCKSYSQFLSCLRTSFAA